MAEKRLLDGRDRIGMGYSVYGEGLEKRRRII